MSRYITFFLVLLLFLMGLAITITFHWGYLPTAIFGILLLIGIADMVSNHNILRLYPISGHLRYLFEFVRPEIQQYFVATNLSGRPYNRELRSLIYQRAKNVIDTHPFGTEHDVTDFGYVHAQHSLCVKETDVDSGRVSFGSSKCQQPYHASRINISAMSYGALSSRAIQTLNRGAKIANMAHNTGEGGLSEHHLKEGGDIIWQLGTAYFGTRTKDGGFDSKTFEKKSQLPAVKMIEIKLSQGAKPSHGGVLPAPKVTAEIARIRGIEEGKDCISPPTHSTFSTPIELMQFIDQLRHLSGGKPIGFKLCIGKHEEFMAICKAMLETGTHPDFITVDGAEGGTGAAPLEFSNRLGTPADEALALVHNCLVGVNLRQHIRIISSAKVATGFDVVRRIALGADACNLARPMMFALGCIQSLRCNTNTCPTGVATTNKRRAYAININQKSQHVANLHRNTIKSFRELMGAMGASQPSELTPSMIRLRLSEGQSTSYSDLLNYLEPGDLLTPNVHPAYRSAWNKARPDTFATN
jgi:glutamate synthase domain-containing protein 2